jgi:hypothetical protein
MLTRSTINGKQPRTLQDAARDPYDWISGPHKPTVIGAEKVIALIAGGCALVWCLGYIAAVLFGA